MRRNYGMRNAECGIKIRNPKSEIRNEKGMALIIVVAIISILSAIGVTFMYEMRLEEKAAFNYMNSLKASYIAKSGIEHAVAVLKEDGGDTGYDAYEDNKWGYKYQDPADSTFSAYIDTDDDSVDNDTLISNSLATVSPFCTAGRDSRWIYVTDDSGDTVGRYAVLIIDESSKININTAGNRQNQGWSPFEVSFVNFLDACGFDPVDIANAWDREPAGPTLRRGLKQYRYGSFGYSGEDVPGRDGTYAQADDDADSIIYEYDGIDNDADGDTDEINEGVDEPDEFVSWNPYYSGSTNFDTPLITTEEIKHVYGISTGSINFGRIKSYITVYSSDENTCDSGFIRMNINLVKDAMALYTVMYDAWEDLYVPFGEYDYLRQLAAQTAVNTIDYADTDNVTTFLEISDGAETTIARGVEAIRINEVMVKPAYQWEAEELFGNHLTGTDWDLDTPNTGIYSITPSDPIDATIQVYREGFYRVRALTYATAPDIGTATGATNNLPGGPPTLTELGAGWVPNEWQGATITIFSGAGEGQTRRVVSNTADTLTVSEDWTILPVGDDYSLAKDHSFSVRIYDGGDDILEDTAGAHNIGGWLLEDFGVVEIEELSDYTIELKTSANLNTITQVTEAPGARLDYIQFSQQPDCEYVELVNISDKDIDISGWTLTTSGGWAGTIPGNPPTVPPTIIEARDYMVLAVDMDDSLWLMFEQEKDPNVPKKKKDNIFFENTWPEVSSDKVVQLRLSTAPVNIAENVFGDTIVLAGSIFEDSPLWGEDNPDTPMAVTLWKGLRDREEIVAQVDYSAEDVQSATNYCYTQSNGVKVYGFIALEKNDPTAITDFDLDDVDDFWYTNIEDLEVRQEPPLPGGTPGGINSMCEKGLDDIDAQKVRNLPFATIGDIKEVSVSDTTNEWSKIGWNEFTGDYIDDIRELADKITVSEKRLEVENGYWENISWSYEPTPDTFLTPIYSVTLDDDPDTWWWGVKDRIQPDTGFTGFYDLYVKGMIENDSGLVEVTVTTLTNDGVRADTRLLTFTPDGTAYFGQIQIGGEIPEPYAPLHVPDDRKLLAVCIKKQSGSTNKAYFDAVILAPEHRTYGRININTADTSVLQALPGINAILAENIVIYREDPPPRGPFKNIGEILDVSTIDPAMTVDLFSQISNLIATKSKVFTIISHGQALRRSDKGTEDVSGVMYEILGDKKYMVVMER